VLCHGDFQPSNFLYQDGKVTGIIDWELSHVGDPREDIGWLAQMQLMTGLDLMGAVKVDGGFLGHYTKLTGIPVTPEDVRFFQLFMASSIGAPIVAAVKRRLEGAHSEFLHVYMLQPIVASAPVFAAVLGYPPVEGVA
jgi:aminoglycoside phosphotransferase (APT) family kinase protein